MEKSILNLVKERELKKFPFFALTLASLSEYIAPCNL